MKLLEPGQVTFVVMSEAATREPHRLIAATVGVAIPRDRDTYGYLSEHHSFGESEDIAGDYAEELAAEMLATTLGLEFDPDKSWDEKKEVYRLSNEIVRTQNVTQTAVGDKRACGRPSSPRPSWSVRRAPDVFPLPLHHQRHEEHEGSQRLYGEGAARGVLGVFWDGCASTCADL